VPTAWPWSKKPIEPISPVGERTPGEEEKENERDFIDHALKRVEARRTMDSENRTEAIDSLKFLEGINQWDDGEKQRRKNSGRPMLQMNTAPTFTHEVIADGHANKFRVKVHPSDMDGNLETAKIKAGIISQAEYVSSADSIYLMARTCIVECGFGAWRVLTRYTQDNPFLQEMYLDPIFNPFNVFMDVNANPWLVYADANWCGITGKISKDSFEEFYPHAELPTDRLTVGFGIQQEHWWTKDDVTVLEFYWRVLRKETLCLMDDYDVLTEKEANEKIKNFQAAIKAENDRREQLIEQLKVLQVGSPEAMQLQQQVTAIPRRTLPEIKDTTEAEIIRVKYAKLSAAGMIEGGTTGVDVSGKYIPVILATGRKRNIEGKIYISGLIKHAKDPIRFKNWWVTNLAEQFAIQPKTPWLGTPKQFKNFMRDYARANQENWPMLFYNPEVVEGQVIPAPQRMQPPSLSPTAIAMSEVAESNIHDTIGMGPRDVGEKGPERNAAAIIEARRPSDIATSDFSEFMRNAVAHSGRVMESMIPEVYDTPRDVRIRDHEGNEAFAPINKTLGQVRQTLIQNPKAYAGLQKKKINDMARQKGDNHVLYNLKKGRGNVIIDTGPAMSTQRQEVAHKLMMMAQGNPRLHLLVDDIILKALGDPYMDEAAERVRTALKMQQPGLVKPIEGEEEQPPPQQPIPPKVQADIGKVQVQQMKAKNEEQRMQNDKIRAETERLKLMKEFKDQDKETKQMLMDLLKELFSDKHWADEIAQQRGVLPGGDGQPAPPMPQ
jgi:hypothetical protein